MPRFILAFALLGTLVAIAAMGGAGSAAAQEGGGDTVGDPIPKNTPSEGRQQPTAPQSGIYDFKDFNFGTGITECPQAGLKKLFGEPFDRRTKDRVEVYSNGGDDRRTNEEYTCFPQNETSIDTNPAHGQEKNIVSGINDYRLGTGSSGFAASNDNGQTWYSGIIPFPSVNPPCLPTTPPVPNQCGREPGATQGFLVSGGDPAVVFDRAGVAYYVQITFNRDDDTNGITTQRSTNGGYTWSRACIVDPVTTPACGGPGDPRLPGDGVVSFQRDNDNFVNGSIPFDDKEYVAAGPRPLNPATPDPDDRLPPVCYNAAHVVVDCGTRPTSPDRIYVTWTKFTAHSEIMESHSDDQGRSWSPQKPISGGASFCAGAAETNPCEDNQFSTPTVHPDTGYVYVAFENFNTPDENQYLLARSRDGGASWEGPFFITPVYDVNFPRAGASNRQDCTARGQQGGRIVYTNSCFRSNAGGNVVVDRRGGAFADDLYLVMSDNRNGTVFSSNADVFLFKSVDGGTTWIGPSRVNNDRSELTAGSARVVIQPPGDPPPPPIVFETGPGRDCGRPEGFIGFTFLPQNLFQACTGQFGADQWWPWVDINDFGHLNIIFHDRRLDENSTTGEWPTSRTIPAGRPGNYLVWTWGAQCHVRKANSHECLAPGAEEIEPVINPGPDPVPGQGANFLGRFHNFGIQDVPSNFDYCFRAGIFCGDYNNVAVTPNDTKAYGYWTDARNGRSSGGPGGVSPPPPPQPRPVAQPGRNPSCEQADGFVDEYSSIGADAGQKLPLKEDAMFLVTPCPADATQP
jgi:hypothetical protein